MVGNTRVTKGMVSKRYSELNKLKRLAALPSDKFYLLARKWTPEGIDVLVKNLPPYVARDRQAIFEALQNAYTILKTPLCEQDASFRTAATKNAQSTLEIVVRAVMNTRASEKAAVKTIQVAADAQSRANRSDLQSRKYQDLAYTDDLTKCKNQRYLNMSLENEIAEARKYNRPLGLIVFDIDFFKKVNDSKGAGHKAGDYALAELAQTVAAKMIRPQADVFARYAGDEFVFLLPETDEKGAVALAEKVRSAVEAHNFAYKGTKIPVTISMGVAQYNPFDTEDMFSVADRCLYAAKATGRNRVVSASKVREMLKTIPIAKEKIMEMFNIDERWFDYFSKDPPSAPLKTTQVYRRKEK